MPTVFPDRPPGGLELALLGAVRITVDGEERTLRYGKSKALLAYLVVQDRPVVRTTAATLFWDSLPTDRAKANLRVVLNDLRACLGAHLAVDRATIELSRELPVSIDVERLQQACSNGLGASDERELAELLSAGSGQFLEGVELHDAPEIEAFVHLQRTRLRRLSTDAIIAVLGSGGRPQGRTEASIDEQLVGDLVSRLGLLEPWNEEGRRAAMRAYQRIGRPAAALAVYEEFRDGLLAGFGLVPERETTHLAEAIAAQSGVPLNASAPAPRLSRPSTPIFGRESEVASVEHALRTGSRLVTVTGPGGVGKSRLALEVAWRVTHVGDPGIPDGAVVVELADSTEATDLATVTATALGVTFAGYRTPRVELLSLLRDRRLLVILDNGDPVIGRLGPFVQQLITVCPDVQVLLTSRLPLREHAELVLPVRPLPVPPPAADDDTVAANPSARLVMARAEAIGAPVGAGELQSVASLCRQVGGMPLALELVTMQLRLLTPLELVEHLPRTLEAVADDASDRPDRHRTLRRSIQWSYGLLGEDEQRTFRMLGVFRGGAAIGAVAGMIPPDAGGWPAVVRVVDAWLAQRSDGPGGTRLTLSAPIRAFALERLADAGELEAAGQRHARVFLDFATQADRSLRGPDQAGWLTRLETEHDNIQAALTTFVESGDTVGALRMTIALSGFWLMHGHVDEAQHWFERATALPPVPGRPEADALRAMAHIHATVMAARSHRGETAALQLDLARRAAAGTPDPVIDAELRYAEVNVAVRFTPSPDGLALADRLEPAVAAGIARHATWDVARYREYQAWLALAGGDFERARSVAQASRAGFESLGDRWGVALATTVTATVDGLQGRAGEALPAFHGAFGTLRAVGDLGSSIYALACGAAAATLIGDDDVAARMFGAVSVEIERTGMVLTEMAQALYVEFMNLVRTRLGPDRWQRDWDAGTELGLDVDWPEG
jgi:predicted ATPase/DNA-binding SARP family transcriptional activator